MGKVGGCEVERKVGEQVRGMKVRSSVKKLCEGCKVSGRFLWFWGFGRCGGRI